MLPSGDELPARQRHRAQGPEVQERLLPHQQGGDHRLRPVRHVRTGSGGQVKLRAHAAVTCSRLVRRRLGSRRWFFFFFAFQEEERAADSSRVDLLLGSRDRETDESRGGRGPAAVL